MHVSVGVWIKCLHIGNSAEYVFMCTRRGGSGEGGGRLYVSANGRYGVNIFEISFHIQCIDKMALDTLYMQITILFKAIHFVEPYYASFHMYRMVQCNSNVPTKNIE